MGLPEDLVEDLDLVASGVSGRRSEIIREACVRYLEELKRRRLREQMKAGYQEMAEINVLLAEEMMSLSVDEVAPSLSRCEARSERRTGSAEEAEETG